jgi:hypothetical protein
MSGTGEYRIDRVRNHFFKTCFFWRGLFYDYPFRGDGWLMKLYLNASLRYRDKVLRHVHFEKPAVIKMNGKKSLGLVLKPE